MSSTNLYTARGLGLPTGLWTIDPSHSQIGFSVRHMMISKVRGAFTDFSGTVTLADTLADSMVEVSINPKSIDTRDEGRDAHLRGPDFMDVDNFPSIGFKSTLIKPIGKSFEVVGDLSIHGVTNSVTLYVDLDGIGKDSYSKTRAGLSVNGAFSRKSFGLTWNTPIEAGGVVVGDEVKFDIDIELVFTQ